MFYPTIMVIVLLIMEQQQVDPRHFNRLPRNMIWNNCSLITVYVEGEIVLPLYFTILLICDIGVGKSIPSMFKLSCFG